MAVLAKWQKQPIEVQDYNISFAAWLAVMDDTALSVQVTTDLASAGSTATPVDPALALRVQSAELAADGMAKVWLSAGQSGQTYKVTLRCTSTGGRVREEEILLAVQDT